MKNVSSYRFFPEIPFSAGSKIFLLVIFSITLAVMISCSKKDMDINEADPVSAQTNGESQTAETLSTAIAKYYVAPNGNDNNPGTIDAPFATWEKLSSVMTAGDLAYIRGGTYRISKPTSVVNRVVLSNLSGTASNMIKIWAYPGETPVLNLDDRLIPGSSGDGPVGIYMGNNKYVHLKGLRITGLAQNPQGINIPAGIILNNTDNSILEQIEVDRIGGYGIYLQNASDNNLFKNCDVHHIDDRYTGWENANGFNCTGGDLSTNNTFDGCRAWWCGDDGFDFFGVNGVFTLKNCWAFWNGYEPGTFTPRGDGDGFKLGPAASNMTSTNLRTVTNCLAFENYFAGFDQNSGQMKYTLYNNATFKNGSFGYFFGANTSISQTFKNNISFQDPVQYNGSEIGSGPNVSNNSWNGGVTVTNADFMSTSSAGADGARQADGGLPNINFMKLVSSSDLIDAGINVGLLFFGNAPDRGAFEYGGSSGGGGSNQAPSANAGPDRTVTLPTATVTLTGSGSDPDGTIVSYSWARVSGPNTPLLSGANTASLVVNSLVAGTYVFRLTVTDNGGLTAFDDVNVTVSSAVQPPAGNVVNVSQAVANGGYSYYIMQDFGTAADDMSNPTRSVLRIFENGVALQPPHSIHSDITNYGNGRFSHWNDGSSSALYFSASDNSNPKTNGRTYTYTITSATNQAPSANAGADKTITLPTSTVTLSGSGTDPDGTIVSYLWSRVSGPNTPALSGANTATLTANNLVAGTYIFRLTVTDNGGLTAFDDVNVIVNNAVQPPAANAINVSQAASAGGFSYYVVQNFGTPADDMANPTRSLLRIFENGIELLPPHSGHSDIANFGRGRFSHWNDGSSTALYFSASDNSNPKTNGRTYTFSVTTVTNQPPTVNAGPDKTITLPTASVTLPGSASDPDGSIVSYSWTRVSGPNTPALAGANTATLTANNLVAGTYVFRLTATDNGGLTAFDDVKVIVQNPVNLINIAQTVSNGGYSYYVIQNFGTPADNAANPTRSRLRVFENGVELTRPHSSHTSISRFGKGRFSHWDDGTTVALYFSSTDNTNPKTNGRVYTYRVD